MSHRFVHCAQTVLFSFEEDCTISQMFPNFPDVVSVRRCFPEIVIVLWAVCTITEKENTLIERS